MSSIKTAISMPKSLFQETDLLAKKLEVSRSELIVKALTAFIENQKNRQIWEELNRAYHVPPDAQEEKSKKLGKGRYRKLMEGEW